MAATVSIVDYDTFGNHYVRYVDITGDSSYSAGGYLLTSDQVALGYITGAEPIGGNAASAVYKAHWDNANSKVMVMETAAGTPSGTATSGFTGAAITPSGTVTSSFSGAAVTPSATAGAPTITTITSSAGTTNVIYADSTVLNQTTGHTGITGVQAPGVTVGAITPSGTVTSSFSGATASLAGTAGTTLSGVAVAAAGLAEATSANLAAVTFRFMFVGT
jgi:hypothetical protein